MDSTIIANLYSEITSLWGFSHLLTGILGLGLFIYACFLLVKENRQTDSVGKGVVFGTFIAGIILINFIPVVSLFSETTLGSVYDGSKGFASDAADPLYQMAISAIKLIGFYGIVRACFILSKRSNNGGSVGSALVHIFGGTCALNFEVFAVILANTIGGEFAQLINTIIKL